MMPFKAIIIVSIELLAIVASRVIGKRWNVGYAVGGLAFGIYNEVCFEFCWDYSQDLSPMLWRDIPLIVVIAWSALAIWSLTLSDVIVKRLHISNPFIKISADILIFACSGYPGEFLMSTLHCWKYDFPLQAVIGVQIMGYLFVGLLISCAGRAFQSAFDGVCKRR